MEKKILINNNKKIEETNIINQVVFPIISRDKKGFFFIGTGFFINELAWFITAKHNAYDKENKAIFPFYVVQVYGEGENDKIVRHVKAFFQHKSADIVIGKLFPLKLGGKDLTNPTVIFKKEDVIGNEEICTYAYPDSRIEDEGERFMNATFSPNYYHGAITCIKERNDIFFKGKCFETTMLVKGGASGGPVFDSDGYVIGINATGFDFGDSENPVSFITPVKIAYGITVNIGNKSMKLKKIKKQGGILEL